MKVIPAKAGIQHTQKSLDPRESGDDGKILAIFAGMTASFPP
jgi:hypothetical protein